MDIPGVNTVLPKIYLVMPSASPLPYVSFPLKYPKTKNDAKLVFNPRLTTGTKSWFDFGD